MGVGQGVRVTGGEGHVRKPLAVEDLIYFLPAVQTSKNRVIAFPI